MQLGMKVPFFGYERSMSFWRNPMEWVITLAWDDLGTSMLILRSTIISSSGKEKLMFEWQGAAACWPTEYVWSQTYQFLQGEGVLPWLLICTYSYWIMCIYIYTYAYTYVKSMQDISPWISQHSVRSTCDIFCRHGIISRERREWFEPIGGEKGEAVLGWFGCGVKG